MVINTKSAVADPSASHDQLRRSARQTHTENRTKHLLDAALAGGGDVLLRGPQVCAIVGFSLATLYRLLADNNFPRPISLSRRTKAWRMSVVQQWIKDRAADACTTSSEDGRGRGARDTEGLRLGHAA